MTHVPKRSLQVTLAIVIGLATLWVAAGAYQGYWIRGAEGAVTQAANDIAMGKHPTNVRFASFADRSALSEALASGFSVAGFDNILFGFRDYEVKIRVANGDQYNFDAYHRDGRWQLSCCTHSNASELR